MASKRFAVLGIIPIFLFCFTIAADTSTSPRTTTTIPTSTTAPPPELEFECAGGNVSKIKGSGIDLNATVIFEPGSNLYCHAPAPDCKWQGKFKILHVMYAPNATSFTVLTGRNAYYYTLECKSGFNATANATAVQIIGKTSPKYNPKTQTESVKPISLQIIDGVGTPSTKLEVGQEVKLQIKGPDSYTVRPLNCIAYGGKDGKEAYPLWNHTSCSSYDKAIMDDEWNMHDTVAEITMYAFRFVTSENVTIQCSAHVCPKNDTVCKNEFKCPKTVRRRRDAAIETRPLVKREQIASTSFTIIDPNNDSSSSPELPNSICLYIMMFTIATSIFKIN